MTNNILKFNVEHYDDYDKLLPNGMELIDEYCNKILYVMKNYELSMLDLSRSQGRFAIIAAMFQNTINELKNSLNKKVSVKNDNKKTKNHTHKKMV